jgi:hypothetical protein
MWNPDVMEKFAAAVGYLALEQGSLTERLTLAFANLMLVNPEDLPGRLRIDFSALKRQLTRTEVSGNRARVVEKIATLRPDQVRQAAETVLKIYEQLLKRDPLHEFHDGVKL